MSTTATVDARPDLAQQLVADIRRTADWIEQHPDLIISGSAVSINLGFTYKDADRLNRVLAAFGDDATLDTGLSTATAGIAIGDAVQLYTFFDRDELCTPRIEGGDVVYDVVTTPRATA